MVLCHETATCAEIISIAGLRFARNLLVLFIPSPQFMVGEHLLASDRPQPFPSGVVFVLHTGRVALLRLTAEGRLQDTLICLVTNIFLARRSLLISW